MKCLHSGLSEGIAKAKNFNMRLERFSIAKTLRSLRLRAFALDFRASLSTRR